MVTRAEIVAEARSWIGTPFLHQAYRKGVGCDCIGLVGGVCMERGLFPRDPLLIPGVARFVGYSRQPDGVSFRAACDQFLVPIAVESMQPGDAVLMAFKGDPHHIAIVADYCHGGLSIVHAMSHGRCAVAEHRLDATWRGYIVAAYALPGVA